MRSLFFVLLTLTILAPFAEAKGIAPNDAVRAILGEAENQGEEGIEALADALHNRGTLKGVYGHRAVTKHKDGGYYRGNRRIARRIVKWAEYYWSVAGEINVVGGADHWENVKAFGIPAWAEDPKRMRLTVLIKDHQFYKAVK